jgi:dTDP-L-rhamnose 4-epimerase
MTKTVLVTGGAGFIGSHTVDELLSKGYAVRVLDSLQERVHPRGWPAYLPPEVDKVRGDVRSRDDLRQALDGVDAVFHLAAYQDYMPDFSTFIDVNTFSTALLFELIVADDLPVRKIVLASSQSVYGEGRYHCPEHGTFFPQARSERQLSEGEWEISCPACGGLSESQVFDEATTNPHTAYGISKYALEMLALNLGRKYGIAVANMRYSIVHGPRNSFYNAYSGIARIFTLRLLHDKAPVCFEDGQQRRDYVYVGDVARANVLALEDERANFRSFNVAGRGQTTVVEYAELLIRTCGKDIAPIISGEYRYGDTRHTVSSWESLGALGWQPGTPLETIAREYVDWVLEQEDLDEYYAGSETAMRNAGIIRGTRR